MKLGENRAAGCGGKKLGASRVHGLGGWKCAAGPETCGGARGRVGDGASRFSIDSTARPAASPPRCGWSGPASPGQQVHERCLRERNLGASRRATAQVLNCAMRRMIYRPRALHRAFCQKPFETPRRTPRFAPKRPEHTSLPGALPQEDWFVAPLRGRNRPRWAWVRWC